MNILFSGFVKINADEIFSLSHFQNFLGKREEDSIQVFNEPNIFCDRFQFKDVIVSA